MKKNELIAWLEAIEGNVDVMILDGYCPRDLNRKNPHYTITQSDSDDCADCEDKAGETVIILGFGSY